MVMMHAAMPLASLSIFRHMTMLGCTIFFPRIIIGMFLCKFQAWQCEYGGGCSAGPTVSLTWKPLCSSSARAPSCSSLHTLSVFATRNCAIRYKTCSSDAVACLDPAVRHTLRALCALNPPSPSIHHRSNDASVPTFHQTAIVQWTGRDSLKAEMGSSSDRGDSGGGFRIPKK